MANWLIDTGNTKRGFYFSFLQDLFKNGNLIRQLDGSLQTVIQDGSSFIANHTAHDPRNLLIFDEVNPETNEVTTSIGLKKANESVSIPLRLDAVKAFLDSTEGEASPIIALQYQFESPDAEVTTRFAIENAKYVTKVSLADGTKKIIDVTDGSTVWQTPDQKHVINYAFFGKVNGLPNTYYILLNSFRTELYSQLIDSNGNKFFYLDQATGGLKNFLIRPSFTNAQLLDDDVILTSGDTFTIDTFAGLTFLSAAGLTPADVALSVKSNCTCTNNGAGVITVNLNGKETGVVSIGIEGDIVIDQETKVSISRTFKIYRG